MTPVVLRAALGQVEWAGDLDAMLTRLELSVRSAAARGARVIAFPEMCNTSYFCAVMDPALRKLAEPVPDGPTVGRMREVARDTGVVVIVPLAEKDESGDCYNSAAVIDSDGRLVGRYRKQHLPHAPGGWERFYFRPGTTGWPVFNTAVGRVGVLICWDRFFPEAWRALALAGADVIFNPIGSAIHPTQPLWTLVQPASSFVNHVFAGVVNWVGPDRRGDLAFSGGSYFAGPFGEVLGTPAPGSQGDVIVQDLDLGLLDQARRDWPFVRDRRPATYRPLIAPPAPKSGSHGGRPHKRSSEGRLEVREGSRSHEVVADVPILDLDRIEEAASSIDPVFTSTPQWIDDDLNTRLGARVVLKLETLNPIRCFKGRGADWFVRQTMDDDIPLVCASAGNFGQGLAYAARQHQMPVTVFAALNANTIKVDRMRALGATVELAGDDFDAAKNLARTEAARRGWRFVEDGAEPAIAEGAGTIAMEMEEWPEPLDAMIVPIGNGALITGMGAWVKARSPNTRVIGVCATGASAMADSWRSGSVINRSASCTIADGIAIRRPIPWALDSMKRVVDDVVLVSDESLIEATRLIWAAVRASVEPAGAAGVAGLLEHPEIGRNLLVATPLCGANLTAAQAREWLFGGGSTDHG